MSRSAHPAGPRHADVFPEAHAASRARPDVNALDPAIWPLSARRVDGVLQLGGVAVTDLVAEHGTPALFLDEHDLRSRARAYASAFDGVDVYYAGKAFLCTTVARWIAEEGLGLDVCTGGELAVAVAAGFPGERIALHGNNKSRAELQQAVDAGVGHVIVDSFDEIERLAALVDGSAAARPRPGHGRRRGAHARVHRDRARGPEVRLLAARRLGGQGGGGGARVAEAALRRAALAHRLADLRDGRRSRSRRTASSRWPRRSATRTASRWTRSTSAVGSASRT